MKILITGGAGFIGRNLCKFFLDKGYFVRSIDNFSTGHKENIKNLLKNKNFERMKQVAKNTSVGKKNWFIIC